MKKIILLLVVAISLFSCTEEPEVWNSSVKDIAGDWFVQTYAGDGATLVEDFKEIHTYNTAADNGDLYINLTEIITFGSVIKVSSTSDFTFAGGEGIVVSEGTVTPEAASSKMGNTTDSFMMKVTMSGNSYVVKGHRKTGFPEDNY